MLNDLNIDFVSRKGIAGVCSVILLAAGIFGMVKWGFNLGIDFVGGTEIELKFVESPDEAALRATVESLDLGQVLLQRVGRPDENTVLIRVENPADQETGAVSKTIVDALYTPEEAAAVAAGRVNLHQVDSEVLAGLLAGCAADAGGGAPEGVARAILDLRTTQVVFASYDELGAVDGMTPGLRDCLEAGSFLPGFAKWKDYYVGPKVGEELRRNAILAIGVSILFMLGYITLRFRFEYGVGAVVALFHDVLATTGLLVLLGEEFSLPVVAALLTLAGYSINDTIVVFDRIRENLKQMRTKPFEEVVNRSINQTMSRTLRTSLTTLVVVASLLVLGGSQLHGFSVTIFIGVLIGTYSSVFVASPTVLLWRKYFPQVRARRAARA